jgi:hypothetical protein
MSIDPRDMTAGDVAALKHLRLVQCIAVDEAGAHAESLQRLANADAVAFQEHFTRTTQDQLTPTQIALGYKPNAGHGPKGLVYCSAPTWLWFGFYAAANVACVELLQAIEGRAGIDHGAIDTRRFYAFVSRNYGQTKRNPTVAKVAEHFGHGVLDVVDWIDAHPWAFRIGGGPIETHEVELDGE